MYVLGYVRASLDCRTQGKNSTDAHLLRSLRCSQVKMARGAAPLAATSFVDSVELA
jgi:hypothetical protein